MNIGITGKLKGQTYKITSGVAKDSGTRSGISWCYPFLI